MTDFLGISYLVTSGTAAATGIFAIFRQIRMDRRQARIEDVTNKTHDLVNSQSEKLEKLYTEKAFAQGAVAGADAVRADPAASVEGLRQP